MLLPGTHMKVHNLPHSVFPTHGIGTEDPIEDPKYLLDDGIRMGSSLGPGITTQETTCIKLKCERELNTYSVKTLSRCQMTQLKLTNIGGEIMSAMMGVRSNKESGHTYTECCSSLFNSANGVMEVTRDLVIFIYNNYIFF